MELTILGVNSPYPRDGHGTLGYLVEYGETRLLLESGCGIHRRLAEEGLLAKVDAIVQSHLHYDHCADLPSIVLGTTIGKGRTGPLPIFLPPGESERLGQWLAACGFSFVLEFMTLTELTYGQPAAFKDFQLLMRPAQHSLPAGILTLTAGGKRLVYTGDTGDCPSLRTALNGADLALAEVSGLSTAQAGEKGHLTTSALGAMAREAGVRELAVTHFMHGSDPEALTREVSLAFGRRVHTAREGQRYQV